MPESRKRPGNHPHRKKADIPASQRTKGTVTWAVLIAVFALLIAVFLIGTDWVTLVIAGAAGALIGYLIGKRMEKDA
jgi:uncharacterized integral membrane protein